MLYCDAATFCRRRNDAGIMTGEPGHRCAQESIDIIIMKNNYNYLFIIKIILITYLWFPAADLHPLESVFRLCHILQCKITYEGANRPCKSCLNSCIIGHFAYSPSCTIGHFVLITHWLQKKSTDIFADISYWWFLKRQKEKRLWIYTVFRAEVSDFSYILGWYSDKKKWSFSWVIPKFIVTLWHLACHRIACSSRKAV